MSQKPSSWPQHTQDLLEETARTASSNKQSWNTRALLLHNGSTMRSLRSALGWVLWAFESVWDTLYRTLSLAARPQDLAHIKQITQNGIKTVFAEKPIVNTKWAKEYIQNLRTSKLWRDISKQRHPPHIDETKFHDTHGTNASLAPKSSDKRYTKLWKFIPFTAGKVAKIPLRAWLTALAWVTDTFRWMKWQQPRKLISWKLVKTNWNKTKYSWKKLTSRAYQWNTSSDLAWETH